MAKYKLYFKTTEEGSTLRRADKNPTMNKLLTANWKQIQKDFDLQMKLFVEEKKEKPQALFNPKPMQLVLTNDELKTLQKKAGLKVASHSKIDVFYDNQNFHLVSFIGEASVVRDEKIKLETK